MRTLEWQIQVATALLILACGAFPADARPPFAEQRNAFWKASGAVLPVSPPPRRGTPESPTETHSAEPTTAPPASLQAGLAGVRLHPLPVQSVSAAERGDSPQAPSSGSTGKIKTAAQDSAGNPSESPGTAPAAPSPTPEKLGKEEELAQDSAEDPLPLHFLHQAIQDNLGMKSSMQYTGQVYKNTRGGLSNDRTRYRGNLDFSLTADTEKLGWWEGGTIFLYTQDTHGQSLTATETGDYMFYSLLETYPKPNDVNQVGELWYEHKWLEGRLSARIGRLDGYLYFANQELTEGFINGSFTLIPPTTVPAWPFQVLGLFSKYRFEEGVEIKAGVYDSSHVGPQYFLNPLGDHGVITFGELVIPTRLLGAVAGKFGNVRLGGFYDTQQLGSITPTEPQIVHGNYGFYAAAQQMLIVEKGSDKEPSKEATTREINAGYTQDEQQKERAAQGLALFAQYGWAPADRNYLYQYYSAGFLYRGPFRNRDDDLVGIGFGTGLFGRQTFAVDGSTYETVTELFYRLQLKKNIILQPDIQYIANSGGAGRDAFPIGLHFILTL